MKLTDEMVGALDEALKRDSSGNLSREVMRSLARLESRITTETHKLHRPEDYRTLKAAADAIQAAQQTMALYQSSNP